MRVTACVNVFYIGKICDFKCFRALPCWRGAFCVRCRSRGKFLFLQDVSVAVCIAAGFIDTQLNYQKIW